MWTKVWWDDFWLTVYIFPLPSVDEVALSARCNNPLKHLSDCVATWTLVVTLSWPQIDDRPTLSRIGHMDSTVITYDIWLLNPDHSTFKTSQFVFHLDCRLSATFGVISSIGLWGRADERTVVKLRIYGWTPPICLHNPDDTTRRLSHVAWTTIVYRAFRQFVRQCGL